MLKKEWSLVITFQSTVQAIATEKFCLSHGLPGRLIPVPREIRAGCGLAWKAAIENKETIVEHFSRESITFESIIEIKI